MPDELVTEKWGSRARQRRRRAIGRKRRPALSGKREEQCGAFSKRVRWVSSTVGGDFRGGGRTRPELAPVLRNASTIAPSSPGAFACVRRSCGRSRECTYGLRIRGQHRATRYEDEQERGREDMRQRGGTKGGRQSRDNTYDCHAAAHSRRPRVLSKHPLWVYPTTRASCAESSGAVAILKPRTRRWESTDGGNTAWQRNLYDTELPRLGPTSCRTARGYRYRSRGGYRKGGVPNGRTEAAASVGGAEAERGKRARFGCPTSWGRSVDLDTPVRYTVDDVVVARSDLEENACSVKGGVCVDAFSVTAARVHDAGDDWVCWEREVGAEVSRPSDRLIPFGKWQIKTVLRRSEDSGTSRGPTATSHDLGQS
ncbi:hypothetical protein K438DRAFT_1777467 [Mycena galopus ATCC 62051]|nr:hypothetical protein K438DRAFT_1777467 [Mycena galopus ATCC 62051]